MSDTTSIESRFEGHPIIEAGIAQIPNMLLMHYCNLGLNDGQYTLLSHIISRKWTKEAPYPSIAGIRMSANVDTRRRHVRDLRQKGLLFTTRLRWTKRDQETNPHAMPGQVRSNLWYLGSLLHNLARLHHWLEAGGSLDQFQIEIPLATVKMFLAGEFDDTPKNIAAQIVQETQNGTVLKAVKLVCENHIVAQNEQKANMRFSSTRKSSTRKSHTLKEESVTNKNQSLNKNQAAVAVAQQSQDAAAAAEKLRVEEKVEDGALPIQENAPSPRLAPLNGTNHQAGHNPPIPPCPERILNEVEGPVEGASGDPFTEICRMYRAEIGEVSPFIEKEIQARLATCQPQWFELAIGKAAAAGSRKWAYVRKILTAWEACGGPENDHKAGNKQGAGNNDNPYRTTTIAGLKERAIDNPIKKRFNPKTGETYFFDVRTKQRVAPPD